MSAFDLIGIAAKFAAVAHEIDHAAEHGIEQAAILIEETAKNAIGTYEFGWPALQPETIARKSTGDSPLLESGALKDSIEHVISGKEADVGTNDEKAFWMEEGTSRIPPRPFMSAAAMQKEGELREIFGHIVAEAFTK